MKSCALDAAWAVLAASNAIKKDEFTRERASDALQRGAQSGSGKAYSGDMMLRAWH